MDSEDERITSAKTNARKLNAAGEEGSEEEGGGKKVEDCFGADEYCSGGEQEGG